MVVRWDFSDVLDLCLVKELADFFTLECFFAQLLDDIVGILVFNLVDGVFERVLVDAGDNKVIDSSVGSAVVVGCSPRRMFAADDADLLVTLEGWKAVGANVGT